MKKYRLDNFKGGWIIGNFEPSLLKSKDFEVCYKFHVKGERWPVHYHKVGTEYNVLIRGEMLIKGERLFGGDVFVIEPGEVADPVFVDDCEVLIVKTPSVPGDKYEV